MGLMTGRTVLVFGIANKNSIAYGIARALRAEGAEIAITYAMPKLEHRVRPLAAELGATFVEECDVTNDEHLDRVFAELAVRPGGLHGVVHAVAFASREDLNGDFIDVSREGFLLSLDVSAYSLIAIARRAVPLMTSGGCILTMSSYAAEKVFPHYNVMAVAKAALECEVRYLGVELGPSGVRVNAISAGLVRTLAAQAMENFQPLYRLARVVTPTRRNTTTDDVGHAALYLLSDMGSGVTGETLHVDGGYSALGMMVPPGFSLDSLTDDSEG
jgi:enoyl-[acyl-carrier protein] reductase I